MSLSNTRVAVEVSGTHVKTLDLGDGAAPFPLQAVLNLLNGTGAAQADLAYFKTRTITASSNEDLDLAGSLTDAYGATLTFARIKAVIIAAAVGNTNNVRVTRPASNGVPLFLAASDGIDVRPGGFFAWGCSDATGIAVTAGTGDLINVANSSSGTSVTYTVIIIGASA